MIRPKRPSSLLDYVLQARDDNAQVSLAQAVPDAFKPFLARLFLLQHMNGVDPVALYEGPVGLR